MKRELDMESRGYALDLGQLAKEDADRFRAGAWVLSHVDWGTKARLLEVARSIAATAPKASLWMIFEGKTDEQLALQLTHGGADFVPGGGLENRIAKTFALDKRTTDLLKTSLHDSDGRGRELAPGALRPRTTFDSAVLKRDELAVFRVDRNWFLHADELDKVRARALERNISISAVITEAFLVVRGPLREGKLDERLPLRSPPANDRGLPGRVFLSLPAWAAYDLETIAADLDRSESWVLQQGILRAIP